MKNVPMPAIGRMIHVGVLESVPEGDLAVCNPVSPGVITAVHGPECVSATVFPDCSEQTSLRLTEGSIPVAGEFAWPPRVDRTVRVPENDEDEALLRDREKRAAEAAEKAAQK